MGTHVYLERKGGIRSILALLAATLLAIVGLQSVATPVYAAEV